MKRLLLLVLVAGGIGLTTERFLWFPRMSEQPSVKPFETNMPRLPEGTVPFGAAPSLPRTKQEAAAIPNPVRATPKAVRLGRLYYGYYCEMCHGRRGDGNGRVGQSYEPRPTDLRSAKIRAMSDGELAVGMVVGVGHVGPKDEPILEPTVALERRWRIVHYLRTLGAEGAAASP
jgi:hypothetical protein